MEGGNAKSAFIWLVICALVIQIVPMNIIGDTWVQTNQVDFEGGETWNTNVTLSPGNVTLDMNPDWWNSSWEYKVPINITENSGEDLTDFQVPIEVDTRSLIAAGKMRPDLGDVRFTDQNGDMLPYWIEVLDDLNYDEPSDYVANYRLDEGDGNTTYDDSPNGNNGTHYGNTKLLMHFDEGSGQVTKDESLYKNHGQLGNTTGIDLTDPTWLMNSELSGNYFEFDGIDDFIEIQDTELLDLNFAHTVEFWINVSSITEYQEDIISKHSWGISNGWRVSLTNTSKLMYTTYPGSGWDSNSTINLNEWYHIAVTFDGSSNKIFINGVLDNQTSVSSTNTNNYNVRIGGMHGNNSFSFHGALDEVGIYSKALPAEEILEHYIARKAVFTDWTSGKFGNALDFDGTDDYVNTTVVPNNQAGTFELWFNPDSNQINSQNVIIGQYVGASFRTFISIWDTGELKLGFDNIPSNSGVFANFNTWNHVAMTWGDGSGYAKLYLNGKHIHNVIDDGTHDFNYEVYFGNFNWGGNPEPGYYFKGAIDEVSIYDRALSYEEIRAIYHEESRIWVNVSSLPAFQTTKIFLYYGNPYVRSTSNFDASFAKDYGENGLVGLWHMDEGLGLVTNDSSGNGNHGTLENGPDWPNKDGGQWDGRNDVSFSSGSALKFYGVDEWVDVPHSSDFNLDNGTFEVWMNPAAYPSPGGEARILGKNLPGWNDDLSFVLLPNGSIRFASDKSADNSNPMLFSRNIINLNVWFHIIGIWDLEGMKLYINGNLEERNSISAILRAGTAPFTIGGDLTGYFNGTIDEVRIYNRSLSQEEIKAHYERRKYANPEPTYTSGLENIGDWRLEGEWLYRKPVTINNTANPETLTDFQVLVEVNTSSLIFSGKMRSNCGDIRFIDSNGIPISYWFESRINTNLTKIWVQVPNIPANDEITIFMYYGNHDANSASDGESTFDFFDDFEDDTIEELPSKWDVIEDECEIRVTDIDSNIGSKCLRLKDTGSQTVISSAKTSFSPQSLIALDIAARIQNNTYSLIGIRDNTPLSGWQNHSHAQLSIGSADQNLYYSSTAAWTLIEPDELQWHNYTIIVNMTQYIKIIKDEIVKITNSPLFTIPENNWQTIVLKPLEGSFVGYDNFYDTVRVRKYSMIEPTATIGLEEGGYMPSGTFISSVFNSTAAGTIWNSISWAQTLPPGTDITIATRSGNISVPDLSWSSWSEEMFDELGSAIPSPRSRYIQYRATFTTTDTNATPVLHEVIVDYTLNSVSSPTLTSPPDGNWTTNNLPTFSWTYSDPNLDSQIQFEVRIDDDSMFLSVDYTRGPNSSSNEFWEPIIPIADGPWFWQVKTIDEYGLWSDWSPYRMLNIDTTAPTQPTALTADPDSWTNVNSFTVNWTNPNDFSGVKLGAWYKIGSPPTSNSDGTWQAAKPISVNSLEGQQPIYIWLEDNVGNVDFMNNATVDLYLDTTPPEAFIPNADPNGWTTNDQPVITFSTNDATSGISHYEVQVDSGIMIMQTSPFTVPSLTDGTHTVLVKAWDNAGNYREGTVEIYIDTTPPSAPLDVGATPDSWTNTNSFVVDWIYPTETDTSGIKVGCWYKIGSSPTSNSDGTWVGDDPITVTSLEGEQTIYIWLEDNLGNVDYNNYATAVLHLDTTPPGPPTGVAASPDSWAFVNSFDIDWINPSDDSGIKVGVWYKIGSPPISDSDGTWIADKPIPVTGSQGENTIYIWLEDNLGNRNHMNYGSAVFYLDSSPPNIAHTPVTHAKKGEAITISAIVTDNLLVKTVTLHYRKQGDESFQNRSMDGTGDVYSAEIPSTFVKDGSIEYYISASDEINTVTYPSSGTTSDYRGIEIVDEEPPWVLSMLPWLISLLVLIALIILFLFLRRRDEGGEVGVMEEEQEIGIEETEYPEEDVGGEGELEEEQEGMVEESEGEPEEPGEIVGEEPQLQEEEPEKMVEGQESGMTQTSRLDQTPPLSLQDFTNDEIFEKIKQKFEEGKISQETFEDFKKRYRKE